MDRMAKVDMMEERLLEAMGAEGFLEALCRALSYDVKEEMYEYIARNYEVDVEEEEEEWELLA